MEDRQMNDISSGLTENPRYVWDKKYVRPYESPWSIIRNFTLLNACCGDLAVTLSLLGITRIRCERKPYFCPELLVYLNMTLKGEEIIKLTDMLAGRSYSAQFNAVRGVSKKCHSVISMKLKYCPVCMKSGYHSVFHQAAGARTCFIHKDVHLVTFWKGAYILGYHDPYTPLSDDEKGRMISESVPLRNRPFDLYSEESLLLPFERISIRIPLKPFNTNIISGKVSEIFIIEGISNSDFVENPAGLYLIEDEESIQKRMIYSSVYDPRNEEAEIKKLLVDEHSDTQVHKDILQADGNIMDTDIVSFIIQRFVKKILYGFTIDELKLKEFDMFLEGFFDTADDLEVKIVFTCLISGVKWAHMALLKEYCLPPYMRPYMTVNEDTIYTFYHDWHAVLWRFGYLCTKAILEDYCDRMYALFVEKTDGRGRIPINKRRLFKKPAYVIEKEADGRVNVYVY